MPDFSAACFYFARELRKTVDVPMGLIVAAWGGSRIQTWMSEAGVARSRREQRALDVLALYAERPAAAPARWGEMWEAWWLQRTHGRREAAPWAIKPSRRVAQRAARTRILGAMGRAGAGELRRHAVVSHDGDLVRAASAAAGRLSLGRVDEMDQTWINGRPIGSAERRRISR